jgi:hypothetical protein
VFALGDYSTGLKSDGSGKLVAKADSGDVVTWEFGGRPGAPANQDDDERNDMCLAVRASLNVIKVEYVVVSIAAGERLSQRENAVS